MNQHTVRYTDPWWAISQDGTIDEAIAVEERAVFGPAIGFDLGLFEDGRFVTSGPRFASYLEGSSAVVAYRAKIDANVLKQIGPGCKVIARQGVGTDTFDLEAIRSYGAYAFNIPDYCVDETSTHALALILSLERDVFRQNLLLKSGGWNTRSGRVPARLSECTLGIIGFGRIGRAVARKASAFFAEIVAFDPAVHSDLMAGFGVKKVLAVEDLVSSSEIVTLHASLNKTSDGLVSSALLSRFRQGSLLINTARGRLVRNDGLLEALESGILAGYATDVHFVEPPQDDSSSRAVINHDRVIATCHRGFLSVAADRSARVRAAEEVRHVLNTGLPPRYGRLV